MLIAVYTKNIVLWDFQGFLNFPFDINLTRHNNKEYFELLRQQSHIFRFLCNTGFGRYQKAPGVLQHAALCTR